MSSDIKSIKRCQQFKAFVLELQKSDLQQSLFKIIEGNYFSQYYTDRGNWVRKH